MHGEKRRSLIFLSPIVPGLIALAMAGCGPGHGMNLGKVYGKVTLGGEPVRYGTVFFVPDASKKTDGPSAMSSLGPDGTFSLSTDSAGDGALVGFHKVGIVGLDPEAVSGQDMPKPETAPTDFLKAKAALSKPARPRAKAKSAADPTDTFTDRGGRVYHYVVPKKYGKPEESGMNVEVREGSNQIDFKFDEAGNFQISR